MTLFSHLKKIEPETGVKAEAYLPFLQEDRIQSWGEALRASYVCAVRGDIVGGIKEGRRAAQLIGENNPCEELYTTRKQLAELYTQHGDWLKARMQYERILELLPQARRRCLDEAGIRIAFGKVLGCDGEWELAERQFRLALPAAEQPLLSQQLVSLTKFHLAEALLMQGKPEAEDARQAAVSSVVNASPGWARSLYSAALHMAARCLSHDLTQDAAVLFRFALGHPPPIADPLTRLPAYQGLTQALVESGRPDDALEELKALRAEQEAQGLPIDPAHDITLMRCTALALVAAGRPSEAVALSQETLRKSDMLPDDSPIRFQAAFDCANILQQTGYLGCAEQILCSASRQAKAAIGPPLVRALRHDELSSDPSAENLTAAQVQGLSRLRVIYELLSVVRSKRDLLHSLLDSESEGSASLAVSSALARSKSIRDLLAGCGTPAEAGYLHCHEGLLATLTGSEEEALIRLREAVEASKPLPGLPPSEQHLQARFRLAKQQLIGGQTSEGTRNLASLLEEAEKLPRSQHQLLIPETIFILTAIESECDESRAGKERLEQAARHMLILGRRDDLLTFRICRLASSLAFAAGEVERADRLSAEASEIARELERRAALKYFDE